MTIMETNDDLKQQLKILSSDEGNLDLNKIMKFTENLIKDQQTKSQNGKEEALKDTSHKGFSSLVKEENLDSLVKIAKTLVNPTTLSLLSKTNNTSEMKQTDTKEISTLKLSVEKLSDELEKLQQESFEMKQQIQEINEQNIELQNKITSLKRRRR